MREDFEKYLTKEEEEEIARGLARGEEDFRTGRIVDFEDLQRELRRFQKRLIARNKTQLYD